MMWRDFLWVIELVAFEVGYFVLILLAQDSCREQWQNPRPYYPTPGHNVRAKIQQMVFIMLDD